ncbi:MAG: nucleotidyltransferase domain-containing protein [Candidatus Odyssella sp.]|nr:nucleotidyltransferase domain-containing protein [Candidatus Odyssella sp.]
MRKTANISKLGVSERAQKYDDERPPTALDHALAVLRAHRAELEAIGVVHAGVFGSVARGEEGSKSDLDVVVDLDDKVRTIYDFAGVWRAISDLFPVSVDVVERDVLKGDMKARVEADFVKAF